MQDLAGNAMAFPVPLALLQAALCAVNWRDHARGAQETPLAESQDRHWLLVLYSIFSFWYKETRKPSGCWCCLGGRVSADRDHCWWAPPGVWCCVIEPSTETRAAISEAVLNRVYRCSNTVTFQHSDLDTRLLKKKSVPLQRWRWQVVRLKFNISPLLVQGHGQRQQHRPQGKAQNNPATSKLLLKGKQNNERHVQGRCLVRSPGFK